MANLNIANFDEQDYATLLASDVLDASKGALFTSTGLQPDTTNRTIIIGLGGTGVRTVDYVKGAIMKRLAPSWKQYVAFLAVDASWSELNAASYLDPSECLMITKNGVAQRMSQPNKYPSATQTFMLYNEQLGSLDSDGCGRTRLAGKIKIHDAAPGGTGVDAEIVQKLTTLRTSVLTNLTTEHGKYQIYVIGSVCGGTCSGGFLEMPALIRKAFNDPKRVSVNGMLYLPDTLAQLDPQNMSQLYANGYATLKELNYYMGMYMRPEYPEVWSYNSNATPELKYKSSMAQEEFINVPYLIGTTNGPSADAAQVAKESIAEFLISTLATITTPNGGLFLTSAFESNANAAAKVGNKLVMPGKGNEHWEAQGEYHEFPKRYSAIGFASAAVPEKLVRAYTVGQVCTMAGLAPIDSDERAARAAGNAELLLPFRSKKDMMNASEGTKKAETLLAPLAKVMSVIHNGDFNFSRDLNESDITWTKIKENHYDNNMLTTKMENCIKRRTSDAMTDDLQKKIKAWYAEYRKNVQEFVREEGPYAFVNLYNGNFAPVNGDFGTGIGRMLQNLVDGKQMNGRNYDFKSVEDTKSGLDSARNLIDETAALPFKIESAKHRDQCAQWVANYNLWGSARINQSRREAALGQHGALAHNFLLPAAKLTEELNAFGCILETMTKIYQSHGEKMQKYDTFRTAQDNKSEVNLAAVNDISYRWLKQQAENTLVTVNARKLRDELVDDFFGMDKNGMPNSAGWLEFPEERIGKNSNGALALTAHEMPVNARERFDQYLAKAFPATVKVSIEEMFRQLAANGNSIKTTAHDIIQSLYAKSAPQFNGDIPEDTRFGFIMYPNALRMSPEGKEIANELETAAKNICQNVSVYASDDADSIMFYQQAAPLEIYRLRDLKLWEKEYENGDYGYQRKTAYLHGMSPDLIVESRPGEGTTYREVTPWSDYPPITGQETDPRIPDDSGYISREGQIRIELDKMIDRAKQLGVLYSEKTRDGWCVKRVYCSNGTKWKFDILDCVADEKTGLYPLGKELAQIVASQTFPNKDNALEFISRRVALALGGHMDRFHDTEELAWQFAARTLRAHVPMMIEVRETLKKFEVWAEEIEKVNATEMVKLLPAKMVWLIKAQVLRNENGIWSFVRANGTKQVIVNLSERGRQQVRGTNKFMLENGMLGYFLFTRLMDRLDQSVADFDDAYKRSLKILDNWADDEEYDLLDAGDAAVKVILDEIAGMQEKGARLEGDTEATPKSEFKKNCGGAGDDDKLTDIDVFYFRLGLWENLS